ncbi:phosphatidylinositol phosphate synthase [Kineosporia babensis]|uniref:Phosphatidylinositol phosphate synthase n=1 Tax=Kineosporia babensis TaxID=499548 RepID=A0A9X1NLJ8_9ACTN|nr:CDP-alcohol phosphatidyltransferase family protein [Kineosporia babensis]MCD5316388.1 CDP-alcohol phosphatidyltransferase family protein [Kineosporia babensis]
MFNRFAKAFFTRVFSPVARLLLRWGVSPDAVTLVGTIGVCFGALAFFPRDELFWGVMVVTAFVFSDLIDGTMARMSGRSSVWGAYLDSTLDRFGDAAVFGGLVLCFAGPRDNDVMMVLSLACLVLGFLVSYSRARAEGLGMQANVGVAERSERLVLTLVATGFVGIGVSEYLLMGVLVLLVVGSVVTIFQRIMMVRRQALGRELTVGENA